MKTKSLPSQESILDALSYNPTTGILTWRERQGNPQWTAAWAGKEAFQTRNAKGHRHGGLFGQMYFAHRIIWKMVHGVDPVQIDHVNGVYDDNRLENLREVSGQVENGRNRKLAKNNSTGVTGVYWDDCKNKWAAKISVGGRMMRLGRYECFDLAAAARKRAELKYGFHENHGRCQETNNDPRIIR